MVQPSAHPPSNADAPAVAGPSPAADAEATHPAPDAETAPTSRMPDPIVLDAALAAARMGIWECSLPDGALTWTRGVFDLYDLPHDAPLRRAAILSCYPGETRQRVEELRARAIRERTGFEADVPITTLEGRSRWIRITARVEARDGVPVRIYGTKRDITEEHALLMRTRYLAEHDMLTGLANRASLHARLDAAAAAAGAGGTLLLVDLDGFKPVNDRHGHACGDAVLKEAAGRIARVVGPAAFAARLGGDEFAVILDCSPIEAEAAAGRIVVEIAREIATAAGPVTIGASIGMAPLDPGVSPDQALERADAALYRAKAAGRGTVRSAA